MAIGLFGLALIVDPHIKAPFWMKFVSMMVSAFVLVYISS